MTEQELDVPAENFRRRGEAMLERLGLTHEDLKRRVEDGLASRAELWCWHLLQGLPPPLDTGIAQASLAGSPL